ncbi:hypothetical protein OH491_20265 [Termitidicoccus mucosus]|uniref:DUF2946 domain-containing protein n=1 Tax=Termitidicoccus mucosus TaxID=1184151 RepID=A0A178IK19_9BACT|nr:hypothetical protein AW736_08455 [Opitutaceae bacterium TSB47]
MQRRAAPATAKRRPGLLPASGAALLAALVVLLSLAGGSPLFHAWLHSPAAECPAHASGDSGHAHDAPAPGAPDNDHACAITLFAQGVHLTAPLAAPTPIAVALRETTPAAPRETRLATPPHLRPHTHAPPV